MRIRPLLQASLVTLLLLLSPGGGADAEWPEDPATNLLVCSESGNQRNARMVPDGAGGAIVVWQDQRTGQDDIHAQRISADGETLWTEDGVGVCVEGNAQWVPAIAPDGSGGAIIAWEDNRPDAGGIYAQRVDAEGNLLWSGDGVPIATVSNSQDDPQIVSDGQGGAILSWNDTRGSSWDVYAQKVDANGSVLWTGNGVPVAVLDDHQGDPRIVTDGAGGAILVWDDGRAAGLYAQRVDANGLALWTTNGIAVCAAAVSAGERAIVADGAGGAVVVWEDGRGADRDIYAQRIDAAGNLLWAVDGARRAGQHRRGVRRPAEPRPGRRRGRRRRVDSSPRR
jgi:hypothetical protein